jgi:hypothetical protein
LKPAFGGRGNDKNNAGVAAVGGVIEVSEED